MKFKILGLALAVMVAFGQVAHAAVPNLFITAVDTSTASGKTITNNLTYASGRKIVIAGIVGRSDLSTSIIQIQEAAAAGSTTSYTTVMRLSNGAQTTSFYLQNAPLFVGKIGYSYRVLLDSTTANSLLTTYSQE
jgi:hypothetical protein